MRGKTTGSSQGVRRGHLSTGRKRRKKTKKKNLYSFHELRRCAKDLRNRLNNVPVRGRSVPKTNNPFLLGRELKIRLAMVSPILVESYGPGGELIVSEQQKKHRSVPVWDIGEEQDPVLRYKVKVETPVKKVKGKSSRK